MIPVLFGVVIISTVVWILAAVVIAVALFAGREELRNPFFARTGRLIASVAIYGVCIFISRVKPNAVSAYSLWAVWSMTIGSVQLAVTTALCAAYMIGFRRR